MCGVLGFIYNKPLFSEFTFDLGLEKLQHRGPDFRNGILFRDKTIGIGHTRLSILDPDKRAHQPMVVDGNVLSFNGEIYNHIELRKELKFSFKTSSDTETLLVGLSQQGASFLKKCRGMFAGCFYDSEASETVLFRDSLGIKNLYYSKAQDGIIFGSEIKAMVPLLNCVGEKLVLNRPVLAEYLSFENYTNGKTLYENIYTLLPGQLIRVSNDLSINESFFSSTASQLIFNDESIVSVGRKVIEDSVKAHLISDYPVGVYLSGGIDSSLVAALASKNKANIVAFTGYFKSTSSYYDERPYSRLVAKHLNIPLREIVITPEHFIKYLDDIVAHLETPRMGMGSFSQFVVAKQASIERRVILSGHGGDELFAGYPMFKAFWMAENPFKILKLTAKELPWIIYFFFSLIVKRVVSYAPVIFPFKSKRKVPFFSKEKPSLNGLFKYYKAHYIPGLLDVEDKISMAHSLETRVPLWDSSVMDFASRIPIIDKMKGGNLKALLKEIASPFVPESLLLAPKRGFPTPLDKWFRNELKDFVVKRLLKDSRVLDAALPIDKRKRLCNSLRYPLPYAFSEVRAHKIWMLLNLESMERQFGVTVD